MSKFFFFGTSEGGPHIYCRVTNRSPNPDRIGYGPNKPNTINL